MLLRIRIIVGIALLLIPTLALAQAPDDPTTDFAPIVLDKDQANKLFILIQNLPYVEAAPIVNLLVKLENDARAKALKPKPGQK